MKKVFLSLLFIGSIGFSFAQRTIKIDAQDDHEAIINKAALVLPTSNQYAYKTTEFNCFIHFGPNTFTSKEWGDGFEDPKNIHLKTVDTDQWCRVAKAAGMKTMVFTVKHHDGFVMWQSRYTKHGIMSTTFKNGEGDVLKSLSASCKKYGLKLGVYLSPADLFQIESKEGLYGNLSAYTERSIPRAVIGKPFNNTTKFKFKVDDYNEYVLNQLFELLTEYGAVHEVWFDGAHPKRKGNQKYNYLAWKELINTLAPKAVIFGKEDVRWCGNEGGHTRVSEWDVVTFKEDPSKMHLFPDMHGDLGSREMLYKGNYLHYLAAETDTSIREGWFYRNDDEQKVRTADDVWDIYERVVGGNATLLLNVPPNREGRFPEKDVAVLTEIGKRIKSTYGNNLMAGATGEKAILDNDKNTFVIGENGLASYEFILAKNSTLNRFLLQEAIETHSQRIEEHALDAWINGAWKQIAKGTTVGYKKILRFAEVTTNKLRIRILKSRLNPSLSTVSAHYYKAKPPQLIVARNLEGQVTISPKKDDFGWNKAESKENTQLEYNIYYTTDGSTPNQKSKLYVGPFFYASGQIKTVSYHKEEKGSITESEFGFIKKGWRIMESTSAKEFSRKNAIDGKTATYWHSGDADPSIIIDMKEQNHISGFVYTPPTNFKEGLIEKGEVAVSNNGKKWKVISQFEFGNLINDPTPRTHKFKKTKARYIKIQLVKAAGESTSASMAELDILK